ncbi:efflux RND transporter permease subunit [Candidatus Comchoanobacter bicostacola]|uniref:Efflux RND transporter permease subunit n=1 Tax=Candidatus Comchoanobacter bicostacola TaxID=2919598 RepID=A0ABY5DJ79_9GAMM|nr:efflux RND transporter permease subunit [Candidatus Comchoanobacter bicostacola]UTC24389.1 efflux RND transporter permease subunit [Candidatus Comchoanobacter bicostacola]
MECASTMYQKPNKLIQYCAQHKVFAHVVLLIVLCIGIVAFNNIQTQLIPNISIPRINTQFIWPGASAKQIEKNITVHAEQAVSDTPSLKNITSITQVARSNLQLDFEQTTDMQDAKQKVMQKLDLEEFPKNMEPYLINVIEPRELMARIAIKYPPKSKSLISDVITRLKNDLSNYGVSSTQTYAAPKQDLILELNTTWLQNHPATLDMLTRSIQSMLRESPGGKSGELGQYTSAEIGITANDILDLNWQLKLDNDPALIDAKHIFNKAYLKTPDTQPIYFDENQQMSEIRIFRGEYDDLITLSNQVTQWFADNNNTFEGYDIQVYNKTWQYFYDRMFLLIKNGGIGLALILILLTLFLSKKDAFWVAIGLPIAIIATIAILYTFGFKINMLSLFALILSLGIIVDDAIVVSEKAASNRKSLKPLPAASWAATEMLKPVLTSSSTTVAAFFPLLFISGVAGQFLREIPIVVITVIIASLIECFLILPKHLSYITEPKQTSRFSIKFRYFRVHTFQKIIKLAIEKKSIVFSGALSMVLITFTLIASGRIKFSFFPDFSADQILVQVAFNPTTPLHEKQNYLHAIDQTIQQATLHFNEDIIEKKNIIMNQALAESNTPNPVTNGIAIWLTSQDQRNTDNKQFSQYIRDNIPNSQWVQNINIDRPRGGPPSDTIQIELSGAHKNIIAAATELKLKLKSYQGTYNIRDDASVIVPNHYYTLNELGVYSGLNTERLQAQLQSYLNEQKNLAINLNTENTDVIIKMPDSYNDYQINIDQAPIQPSPQTILPLSEFTDKHYQYEPLKIIRKNNMVTYTVSAQVDTSVTNTYEIESELTQNTIPNIEKDYLVTAAVGDVRQEQNTTINEIKSGALIGLSVIYLVLVWSLSSFVQPFAILLTLPMSLIGGILGHWILGFDVTLLSLFGFFGLIGVTVNDSIILTLQYQKERLSYPKNKALMIASSKRFRAVILTSLTTIGGLMPLMFETSYQAQFLIPMAITISFGLLFGTFWILVLLPAILSLSSVKIAKS